MTPPTILDVRSGPMGSIEQLRCGLVVALTSLTPPPNEIITRWRQTAIFAASFIFMVWLLIWSGLPIYLAPFVAWAMLVFSLTAASIWADHAHRENITVWRAWRGLGGAVCFAQWIPSRQRHELHTWAAFPRHRGLGGPVVDAAIAQGPRPLWLEPATPELRVKYRSAGFVDDPASRCMILR